MPANPRNGAAARGSVLAPVSGSQSGFGGVVSSRDVARDEDSALWTLEEIGRLVSTSGNAVGDPQQHRPPDSAPVRHRRLLGLPARARSREPRARRDGRPARRRASAASACALTEGLAGLVAEQLPSRSSSPTPRRIRASSTSARPARIPIARSSACRSSIAACCRASSSCRPSTPRAFDAEDVRMLMMAGAQLAPIVSEARTLGQFVAPAHQRLGALAQNLWWSWDPDTTSLFRELDPVLWRTLDNNPVALLQQIPVEQTRRARVAARAAQPHQLRLPPDAGVPQLDAHLGRAPRRRALGAPGRLLLGRVRAPRIAADLLRRPRHPRRRSHQERVGSRHPARRRRPLLRPGLLPAAARSRRLAARGLHRRRSPIAADAAGR